MTRPYLTEPILISMTDGSKSVIETTGQIKSTSTMLAKSSTSEDAELARGLLTDALKREVHGACFQKIIKPFPEELVVDSLKWNELERREHFDHGLSLIAHGKVAVVTLAGGQGTRLGSSHPKGCFDLGLKRNQNLFDLQAGRIQRLEELAREKFPSSKNSNGPLIKWAIMTSPATHHDTVTFFMNKYPSSRLPAFFMQGQLPCFAEEAPNVVLKNQLGETIVSPDGNGGVFQALKRSKILDDWRNVGILHVHVYCVDNILTRVADPYFISVCALAKTPCGIKVGVLALGAREQFPLPSSSPEMRLGIQIVEYSELPSDLASLERNSSLVYKFANIANHYFSLDFLEMAAMRLESSSMSTEAVILPAHIARKNIKISCNPDVTVPGLKLERFIFDILHLLPSPKDLAVMVVSRDDEFSPLKNASVPGKREEGTPESCLDALYRQYRKLLGMANISSINDADDNVEEIEAHRWYFGEPIANIDVLLAKK